MIHGDKDRATSHLATQEFFDRISSTDKELEIYEGYEHVMTKVRLIGRKNRRADVDPRWFVGQVGIDEADDEKRQAVLKDWVGWMCKRAMLGKERMAAQATS
jgi:acylglycerol lipase